MFRVLNIDVLLIKVSITDGRRLILHHIGIFSFFHSGYLEIHPKSRVGSIIQSVNILIHNKGVQLTILYHFWRVFSGCMVTPPGLLSKQQGKLFASCPLPPL